LEYQCPYTSLSLFLSSSSQHPHLLSFPTRRSSDLSDRCLREHLHFFGWIPHTHEAYRYQLIERLPIPIFRQCRKHLGCDQFLVRSEEHTSELQSRSDLVCRLLLEKKKTKRS